jgi:hypothetical protein
VIDTTDKASFRLVLERIRRVLLRGDPRDEHLGPVGDTAGGLSGAGIERLLKNSRRVARHAGSHHPVARPKRDGAPPHGRCQPPRQREREFAPGAHR